MNIYLDHAGIRSDAKIFQPRILRRSIAFQKHRLMHGLRGRFDRGDKLEVIFQRSQRRHENVQHSVSRFRTQRRSRHLRSAFMFLGRCGW